MVVPHKRQPKIVNRLKHEEKNMKNKFLSTVLALAAVAAVSSTALADGGFNAPPCAGCPGPASDSSKVNLEACMAAKITVKPDVENIVGLKIETDGDLSGLFGVTQIPFAFAISSNANYKVEISDSYYPTNHSFVFLKKDGALLPAAPGNGPNIVHYPMTLTGPSMPVGGYAPTLLSLITGKIDGSSPQDYNNFMTGLDTAGKYTGGITVTASTL